MSPQSLNLYIVDDDPSVLAGLRNYLSNRFGRDLSISTFPNGESALKNIHPDTNIVIIDNDLKDENGTEVLKSIKKINPNTEVIVLSSNENMEMAIESYRKGATAYVVKNENAWKRVSSVIYKIFMYPVRVMVDTWGMSERLAMFLLTFAAMACIILIALRLSK